MVFYITEYDNKIYVQLDLEADEAQALEETLEALEGLPEAMDLARGKIFLFRIEGILYRGRLIKEYEDGTWHVFSVDLGFEEVCHESQIFEYDEDELAVFPDALAHPVLLHGMPGRQLVDLEHGFEAMESMLVEQSFSYEVVGRDPDGLPVVQLVKNGSADVNKALKAKLYGGEQQNDQENRPVAMQPAIDLPAREVVFKQEGKLRVEAQAGMYRISSFTD